MKVGVVEYGEEKTSKSVRSERTARDLQTTPKIQEEGNAKEVFLGQVKEMAKRKSRRGRGKSKKIPILATGGIAIGTYNAFKTISASTDKGESAIQMMTGFTSTGTFVPGNLMIFWAPTIAGVVGSKLASKFGLNRYISQIPLLKL